MSASSPARSALVGIGWQRLNLGPTFLQFLKHYRKPRVVVFPDAWFLIQPRTVYRPLVQFVYDTPRYLPALLGCLGARNSPMHPRTTPRIVSPPSPAQ